MALTLDATVGGAAANSYIDAAAADALMEAVPWAAAPWALLTTAQKELNLVRSTLALDIEYDWLGFRAAGTQALEWPRGGVYVADRGTVATNSIPIEIQRATAELAYFNSQQTAEPEASAGLKKVTLPGGLGVEFRESTVTRSAAVPEHIEKMIRKFVTQAQSGGYAVRVVRV